MPDGGLREQKLHGNALFPMDVYTLEQDEDKYNKLYCHWHREFEILFVTKGGGEFHIADEYFPVYAGEAVCVSSNMLHAAVSLQGLPCHYFAMVFDPSFLCGSAGDIIQQKYIDPVLDGTLLLPKKITSENSWGAQTLASLQRINDLFSKKPDGFELLAKSELCTVWYLLCSHADRLPAAAPKKIDRKAQKIKSVLEYIHQNYSRDIRLAELADVCGLSEGQFCRFFRSAVKMPAIRYLNYYRISQSTLLLQDESRKISDIAGAVGFNNISYYNKEFRQYMRCSPTDYRKQFTNVQTLRPSL